MQVAITEIETSTVELNEDNEFECTHDVGQRVETYEVDTMRNGEHDTYEERGYVCDDCGAQLDGDPDEDAHDAMVDAQIDQAREADV